MNDHRPYPEPVDQHCPHCGQALPVGEIFGDAAHSRAGFSTRGKGKDEKDISMWRCHVHATHSKETP